MGQLIYCPHGRCWFQPTDRFHSGWQTPALRLQMDTSVTPCCCCGSSDAVAVKMRLKGPILSSITSHFLCSVTTDLHNINTPSDLYSTSPSPFTGGAAAPLRTRYQETPTQSVCPSLWAGLCACPGKTGPWVSTATLAALWSCTWAQQHFELNANFRMLTCSQWQDADV